MGADSAIFTGAERASVKTRTSYRHDLLDVPIFIEEHIYKYSLAQRECLVWLIFKKGYTLREAAGMVDDGFDMNEKLNWHAIDRYALDNSKTFVNGRVYL